VCAASSDSVVTVNYWDHRTPARRTRSITEQDIARAASLLLDEGGLRALTVRAVAQRLDVAAPSLYSRIRTVDDLFDLALDQSLGDDPEITAAVHDAPLHRLMLTYYRHLVQHRWACQVIAMRAPRGPNYLRLSERMCTLLATTGTPDPLGSAYALSNFVIGSASTAPMIGSERTAPVDPDTAPTYARLHENHTVAPETIVAAGLAALGAPPDPTT
jgi:AcrR family transcriptional regulator